MYCYYGIEQTIIEKNEWSERLMSKTDEDKSAFFVCFNVLMICRR
jgi:hypothetical protein